MEKKRSYLTVITELTYTQKRALIEIGFNAMNKEGGGFFYNAMGDQDLVAAVESFQEVDCLKNVPYRIKW